MQLHRVYSPSGLSFHETLNSFDTVQQRGNGHRIVVVAETVCKFAFKFIALHHTFTLFYAFFTYPHRRAPVALGVHRSWLVIIVPNWTGNDGTHPGTAHHDFSSSQAGAVVIRGVSMWFFTGSWANVQTGISSFHRRAWLVGGLATWEKRFISALFSSSVALWSVCSTWENCLRQAMQVGFIFIEGYQDS